MVLMSDIVYIILKCHCPILIVSPHFIMFLIPYYFHASIQYFFFKKMVRNVAEPLKGNSI